MGNLFFKSTETDICSLCTLAVYYGCKIKFSLALFPFFLYYVIVQICPLWEKGFITINYYIQELAFCCKFQVECFTKIFAEMTPSQLKCDSDIFSLPVLGQMTDKATTYPPPFLVRSPNWIWNTVLKLQDSGFLDLNSQDSGFHKQDPRIWIISSHGAS